MARRARVEAVLQTVLTQDKEITASRVGRALGHSDYLRNHPDLAALVEQTIQPHNAQVKQRWHETLKSQIARLIGELKKSTRIVTLRGAFSQMGMPYDRLSESYPELSAMVRQAVEKHQVEAEARRTQMMCARINEVAARLMAERSRITWTAILKGAGLTKYRGHNDPVIHNLIQQWIGGFDPQE